MILIIELIKLQQFGWTKHIGKQECVHTYLSHLTPGNYDVLCSYTISKIRLPYNQIYLGLCLVLYISLIFSVSIFHLSVLMRNIPYCEEVPSSLSTKELKDICLYPVCDYLKLVCYKLLSMNYCVKI